MARNKLVRESVDLDTYAREYQLYPPKLLPFLPAATHQVREDPEMKDLEGLDRKAFRMEVAFRAFKMNKLGADDRSSQHLDQEPTDMDQKMFKESLEELEMRIPGLSSLQLGTGSQEDEDESSEDSGPCGCAPGETPRHVRVFYVDGEGFLLRLGPKTLGGLSSGGLMSALFGAGLSVDQIQQLIQTVKEKGEATFVRTHYSPAGED